MRPRGGAVFGDSDVVGPEEDGGYAIDVYELGGERRGVRRSEGGAGAEVFEGCGGYRFGENALIGVEFEGLALLAGGSRMKRRGGVRQG